MSAFGYSIKDVMELAVKKVSVKGWVAYEWRAAEADNIVIGDVPDGVYLSGPRKGRPRFSSKGSVHKKTIVVTRGELEQAATAYEAETGKCWNCKGTNQIWAGWSAAGGVTYQACRRCALDSARKS